MKGFSLQRRVKKLFSLQASVIIGVLEVSHLPEADFQQRTGFLRLFPLLLLQQHCGGSILPLLHIHLRPQQMPIRPRPVCAGIQISRRPYRCIKLNFQKFTTLFKVILFNS